MPYTKAIAWAAWSQSRSETGKGSVENYPPGMTDRDLAHVNGVDLIDDEPLSECCGAKIIHTDLCSECMEHI
jgi:hypothetical protein